MFRHHSSVLNPCCRLRFTSSHSSEQSDSSSDDFEKVNVIQPALCTTFPLELKVEAKAKQEVKENLWDLFFSDYGRGVSMYRTYRARELIMKGIPDKYRGEIWMLYSGAINELQTHQGYYQMLVEQSSGKRSVASDEIERDLHRSLPEHPAFQSPLGINSLRRVRQRLNRCC